MNCRVFGFLAVLGASASFTLALPAAAAAASDQTMPTCAAGDPVVWENSSSKVYHLKGDKYFGNTKSGTYACKSAADGAGFHAPKSKASHGAATSMASAEPDAMTSPSASGSPMAKHHHHKKGAMSGASASPAPAPTGT